MRGWTFALAVGITSVALVAVIGAAGFVAARSALAGAPWMAAAPFGPRFGPGNAGFDLPPELEGLRDVPPAELFAHFSGVQVNLKDRDNNPVTIKVTPGTVTQANDQGLTIAANDGTTRSFARNERTVIRGKSAQDGATPAQASLATGDKVVVVTLNDDTTARAVINGGAEGFTPGAWGGPGGRGGWGPWHR